MSCVGQSLFNELADKLQKLLNHAIRVITKLDYYSSTSALHGKLGWDNLYTQRKKQNLKYWCLKLWMISHQSKWKAHLNPYAQTMDLKCEDKFALSKPHTDFLKSSSVGHSYEIGGTVMK